MSGGDAPIRVRTVAVIGAGETGRGFALACAAAGFHVVLEDVMPAKLRRAAAQFAELGAPAGRLEMASTVEDAVREADLAVDFVPDELESKLEIFSMIDRMAPPKTVLLTPSDTQSITDLASCVYRPDKCVAVRGELARGGTPRVLHPAAVAEATLQGVAEFLHALGIEASMEPDPDAPVLMKNLVRNSA